MKDRLINSFEGKGYINNFPRSVKKLEAPVFILAFRRRLPAITGLGEGSCRSINRVGGAFCSSFQIALEGL
jgi:hypothetical protein